MTSHWVCILWSALISQTSGCITLESDPPASVKPSDDCKPELASSLQPHEDTARASQFNCSQIDAWSRKPVGDFTCLLFLMLNFEVICYASIGNEHGSFTRHFSEPLICCWVLILKKGPAIQCVIKIHFTTALILQAHFEIILLQNIFT